EGGGMTRRVFRVHVIYRIDQPPAKEVGPQTVDRGLGKYAIVRRRHPAGQRVAQQRLIVRPDSLILQKPRWHRRADCSQSGCRDDDFGWLTGSERSFLPDERGRLVRALSVELTKEGGH